MHSNCDSAVFPWGESAQPGVKPILVRSCATVTLRLLLFKEQLYFSTTYRYLKEIYLDPWQDSQMGSALIESEVVSDNCIAAVTFFIFNLGSKI